MLTPNAAGCALRSLLACTLLMSPLVHAAAPSQNCAALKRFQIPGVAMTIDQATAIEAGIPAPIPFVPPFTAVVPRYCRADGTIDSRVGQDGKPYAIKFAIALPENWNGRFLFQGGGGLNGSVIAPLGYAAAGDTPALARGFAVVSTDTGHQSKTAFDDGFLADQQATLNFLYQAIGKVTVVAKQIVTHYYQQAAKRSYYVGCSTGGREAMIMSQRYPGYFDGIVAGAPAMRTGLSNLGDKWVRTAINQIAPRDAAGTPQGSQAFSDGDKRLIIDSLLKACDARDGLQDGLIENPGACDFDPATLTCPGAKQDGCLSQQQVAALRKGFAGPKDSHGQQIYPGFFYDTGIDAKAGIPGLLLAAAGPLGGPVPVEMDVDREADAVRHDPQIVGDSDSWINLGTFSGHGGKLIFFHGVSDPWFSAKDTISYYERLGAANGNPTQVLQWSRLFLVPGMGHCGGGAATLDRFDMLDAVVNWVEKGTAPDAVVATGGAFPGRSRPLCAYPEHAHYKDGDPQLASSFECRR
jgi:feruloyl esterase